MNQLMRSIKHKSYNTIHDKYQTATCFGTELPPSGSRLLQTNISPTR